MLQFGEAGTISPPRGNESGNEGAGLALPPNRQPKSGGKDGVVKPGNIILLNGTSSSGKTTLAKALQRSLDEPYLHLGNDQFLHPNRPNSLLVYSNGTEPSQSEGWVAVFREGRFVDLRVGTIGSQWLKGMFRAMAAWSKAGNHLIADVVLHNQRILQAAVEALHPLPVWFISVYCPLEVAEKREQERGERRAPGGARLFYEGVYRQGVFDLLVDTAVNNPEDCARQIMHHMKEGPSPSAFRQLHQQFTSHP